jgi:WD40 repeat protein
MSLTITDETARGAPRPPSPYVGLVPYEVGDAAFFFGRSTEVGIVVANLRSAPLTLIYGPSGVGKSSLLNAGVIHDLCEARKTAAAESPFAVCVFKSWNEDPVDGLREAARAVLQGLAGDKQLPPQEATLAETFRAWTASSGTLLVILDQFEEYFQYHSDQAEDERLTGFAAELARIVNDPSLAVHVLLSIREDAWAQLDFFEGHIPSLFANYVRVDHLDLDSAREAIEGPIEAWNRSLTEEKPPFEIEPALVEAVIDATAGEGLPLTGARESAAVGAPGDRVQAPYLQLVLERLWRDMVASGARTLMVARLETLGGAKKIVQNHLRDALERLTPQEQEVAADCFRFLVSPSRTKIAFPVVDLAQRLSRPRPVPEVATVLDALCSAESGRILRAIPPAEEGGSASYELYHDILAEPILDWRREYEQRREAEIEARRRRELRRRYVRTVVGLTALVCVFAAFAAWALYERSVANDQRAVSNSRRLAAMSSVTLGIKPGLALRQAVEAVDVDETPEAAKALREALDGSRGRGVLSGHGGGVWSASFSPDGQRLITASKDGTAAVWDTNTMTPLTPLQGGKEDDGKATAVTSARFNPGGDLVAAADADGIVRVWKVSGWTKAWQAPRLGQGGAVPYAFTDGRLAVTADGDGQATVWRVAAARKPLFRIARQGSPVKAAAFSPAGTVVALGYKDGTAIVANERRILWKATRRGPVTAAALSPKRRDIAGFGYKDGAVRFVDLKTGRTSALSGHVDAVTSMVFSPTGKLAVTASEDGTARLWDARSRTSQAVLTGHSGGVTNASFSPDGRLIATAGRDFTARIWPVTTGHQGEPVAVLRGHSDGLWQATFSRDGSLVATASEDGTARLWQSSTATTVPLGGANAPLTSSSFSADGSLLVATAEDGTAVVWDAGNGKRILDVGEGCNVGEEHCYGATFDPDGRMVVTAGADGNARIWDLARKKLVRTLPVSAADRLRSVALNRDDTRLVATTESGADIWSTKSSKDPVHRLGKQRQPPSPEDYVNGGAFSPDGSRVVTAGNDGIVRVWSVRTGKLLSQSRTKTKQLFDAAFSSNGKLIVTAGNDGNATIWDAETGIRRRPPQGHMKRLNRAIFSRDGKYVLTSSSDGTARIFDAETTELLGVVHGFDGAILAASFVGDGGTQVRFVTSDGSVHVDRCETCRSVAELVDMAADRIHQALTTEEEEQAPP